MPWRAPRHSLRSRLALGWLLLTSAAVASLAGVYVVTEHMIEEGALQSEMADELRALMTYERQGEHVPLISTTLRYYAAGAAPASLLALPAGTFRRMRLDDGVCQVLIARDEAGIHVLTHDLTLTERREQTLLFSLAAGVSLAAVGAWWTSGGLVRRILAPLTRLVAQIRGINPLDPSRHPVSRAATPISMRFPTP